MWVRYGRVSEAIIPNVWGETHQWYDCSIFPSSGSKNVYDKLTNSRASLCLRTRYTAVKMALALSTRRLVWFSVFEAVSLTYTVIAIESRCDGTPSLSQVDSAII